MEFSVKMTGLFLVSHHEKMAKYAAGKEGNDGLSERELLRNQESDTLSP
ncbi:hypothetical protein OSR40_015265 [Serratia rubidaea]|nr:hypothetical protein [Serratia rubidaea]MDK1705094.1 hypothetical protein [Serratia rubidaea]